MLQCSEWLVCFCRLYLAKLENPVNSKTLCLDPSRASENRSKTLGPERSVQNRTFKRKPLERHFGTLQELYKYLPLKSFLYRVYRVRVFTKPLSRLLSNPASETKRARKRARWRHPGAVGHFPPVAAWGFAE